MSLPRQAIGSMSASPLHHHTCTSPRAEEVEFDSGELPRGEALLPVPKPSLPRSCLQSASLAPAQLQLQDWGGHGFISFLTRNTASTQKW